MQAVYDLIGAEGLNCPLKEHLPRLGLRAIDQTLGELRHRIFPSVKNPVGFTLEAE